MNTSVAVIVICLILGAMVHAAAWHVYPWNKKQQPIFWIASFSPMILMSLMHLDNNMISSSVYAVCGGAIVSEFLRPKIQAWKQSFKKKLEGDPKMYSKKPSSKSSKSQSSKKRR